MINLLVFLICIFIYLLIYLKYSLFYETLGIMLLQDCNISVLQSCSSIAMEEEEEENTPPVVGCAVQPFTAMGGS